MVVAGGENGVCPLAEITKSAVRVDPEIVDDRVHGEREGVLQFALGADHDLVDCFERFRFAGGFDNEAHSAAGHAAEHPEAPEIVAEFSGNAGDESFGKVVGGPGDDRLERAAEVLGGELSEGANVAGAQGIEDLVEEVEGVLTSLPFGFGTEEVFLGDHFENGADILGHATVHKDEGIGESLAGLGGNFLVAKDVVLGHEATPGDSVFGVGLPGDFTFDELDAGPDSTGVLPAAAGAADPFAKNGSRKYEASLTFGEFAGE